MRRTYPEDVAGIVLVDAYSEFLADHMPGEAFASYADYASVVPDFLADYTAYETIDFARTSDVLRDATGATPLPAIPYEVLSKGEPFGLEGDTPGIHHRPVGNRLACSAGSIWRHSFRTRRISQCPTAATISSSNVPSW